MAISAFDRGRVGSTSVRADVYGGEKQRQNDRAYGPEGLVLTSGLRQRSLRADLG
jgi:hypothetical protein